MLRATAQEEARQEAGVDPLLRGGSLGRCGTLQVDQDHKYSKKMGRLHLDRLGVLEGYVPHPLAGTSNICW